MSKQNQNEHPQQDLNTPSNVVANASRYNNNAYRSNSTETGGNSVIADIGKLLTVMGVQADTIRTLSKISGQSYNNRQMHEMHNSLFGGPTGDYGTDISDLLTNATNYIKQQNQQIQKVISFMHASQDTVYLSYAITIENKCYYPGSPSIGWLHVVPVQSQKHFNDNAISPGHP